MIIAFVVDTLDNFSWVCYFVDGSNRNHDVSLLTKTRPTSHRHYPVAVLPSIVLQISSTTTTTATTTMSIFSRKKQHNDDADGQNGERKKEKGSWRRPASKSCRQVVRSQSDRSTPPPSRYRFQATTSESMAAYTHPKNRLAYAFHHWYHIRPNRRSARVGKQPGMPPIHPRFIFFTFLHMHPHHRLFSVSYRCLK